MSVLFFIRRGHEYSYVSLYDTVANVSQIRKMRWIHFQCFSHKIWTISYDMSHIVGPINGMKSFVSLAKSVPIWTERNDKSIEY